MKVGDIVRHPAWGRGAVTCLYADETVDVNFEDGQRNVLREHIAADAVPQNPIKNHLKLTDAEMEIWAIIAREQINSPDGMVRPDVYKHIHQRTGKDDSTLENGQWVSPMLSKMAQKGVLRTNGKSVDNLIQYLTDLTTVELLQAFRENYPAQRLAKQAHLKAEVQMTDLVIDSRGNVIANLTGFSGTIKVLTPGELRELKRKS
jgi:hypothetical protein